MIPAAPDFTGLIVGAVLFGILGLAIWLGNYRAKQQGIAEQAATDAKAGKEAEEAIHQIQAETRDTAETRARLNDGSF